MLRLLLDEHMSSAIAEQLAIRGTGVEVASVHTWEGGRLKGRPDETVVAEAQAAALTLVTYDRRTIEPILRRCGDKGIAHGGVVFIDNRTIRSSDYGTIIRALERLWAERGHEDWSNQVVYLAP